MTGMSSQSGSHQRAIVAIVAPVLLLALVAVALTNVLPRPVRADLGWVPAVDRFDYSSWDTEIDLRLDEEGYPELRVRETVVAQFPDSNQNKGIARGIPYFGYRVVDDVDVTRPDGSPVPWTREPDYDASMLYLLIGGDEYVHGEQAYVISYTHEQPILIDPDTANQELYWNLLPLDSAQAIERFSATIRIDAALTDSLNGDLACYQARYGSRQVHVGHAVRGEAERHATGTPHGPGVRPRTAPVEQTR